MLNAIQQFRENMVRVRALGGLYEVLCRFLTHAVDCTDILRAQIVLSVSALDSYMHEVTRIGMIEAYKGKRPNTDSFLRYQISMDTAIKTAISSGSVSWFEAEIRERHGYLTFQQPDKIADAIRLFSDCDLWSLVAAKLGLPVKDVKDNLRLIIDRRNKIAHEADLDPSYPGTLWPISQKDAKDAVDFIELICESIHAIII